MRGVNAQSLEDGQIHQINENLGHKETINRKLKNFEVEIRELKQRAEEVKETLLSHYFGTDKRQKGIVRVMKELLILNSKIIPTAIDEKWINYLL